MKLKHLIIISIIIFSLLSITYGTLYILDKGTYYDYRGCVSTIQLQSNSSKINNSNNNFQKLITVLENSSYNITESSLNEFSFYYMKVKKYEYSGNVILQYNFIEIFTIYQRDMILTQKLQNNNEDLPFNDEYLNDIDILKEYNNELLFYITRIYDVFIKDISYDRYDGGYTID